MWLDVYQVLPSDLFGCFKWPFQGFSDLHLGDQKVTWKKLVEGFFNWKKTHGWYTSLRVLWSLIWHGFFLVAYANLSAQPPAQSHMSTSQHPKTFHTALGLEPVFWGVPFFCTSKVFGRPKGLWEDESKTRKLRKQGQGGFHWCHCTLQFNKISLNSWLKGVPMGYLIMMNPFILECNVTGSFSQCY